MIDFSEKLQKNGDIYIVDSFVFKTRNILNMRKGDDPHYPEIGIDTSIILNYPLTIEVINAYISNYLGLNFIYPNSIEIRNDEKGVLYIDINESFSFLTIVDGEVVLSKTKEEGIDVKLFK